VAKATGGMGLDVRGRTTTGEPYACVLVQEMSSGWLSVALTELPFLSKAGLSHFSCAETMSFLTF
jgi:hypothetical protein